MIVTAPPSTGFRRRGRLAIVCLTLLGLIPFAAAAAGPSKRQMAQIEGQLRQHVTTLASDEYGGREPGTPGETLTLRYLARQWFDIGLESGTNDPGNTWFAPVELVEREPPSAQPPRPRGSTTTATTRQ
jgi:hypothetical protein